MATDNDKGNKERNGPGQGLMSPGWILGLVAYMLVVLGFIIYTMISIWPPLRPKEVRDDLVAEAKAKASPSPTPSPGVITGAGPVSSPTQSPPPSPSPSPTPSPARGQATPQPTATATATSTAAATPSASPSPPVPGTEIDCETSLKIKEGFCLNEKGEPRIGVGAMRIFGRCYCIYDEDRLLIIVMLAGALGALIHGFRSLVWYVGNREAVKSWTALYVALPFVGAGIATIFYLVVRGGFFSPTSSVDATSPFGFAALAALIGMFTEPAVLKLRKVATTIFEPPEKGKDHVGPAPKVTAINPPKGTTAGGDIVTVTGSDFSAGIKVLFDTTEASVSAATNTSITVTTPAHAKGKVDVTIVNDDNQQNVVKGGFEYEEPPPVGDAGAAGAAAGALEGAGAGAAAGASGAAIDEEADVDKIDGCDIDIVEETPDEDLPMSEGGVA